MTKVCIRRNSVPNLVRRQIQARIFLQVLDSQPFRKAFNMLSNEFPSEFEIKNNTLMVKLIDKQKLDQFKRGQLKKQKGGLTDLTGKKFPLGRFNSLEISKVLNIINSNNSIRARFGFKPEEVVQTLQNYGKTSVIVNGFNKAEYEREMQNNQNNQNNTSAQQPGVGIRPGRGSR